MSMVTQNAQFILKGLTHNYIVACQAHPVLVFSYMFRALSHSSVCVDQSTLNGLKGWFMQSAPVDSGFVGDPTSLAHNNIGQTLCYTL